MGWVADHRAMSPVPRAPDCNGASCRAFVRRSLLGTVVTMVSLQGRSSWSPGRLHRRPSRWRRGRGGALTLSDIDERQTRRVLGWQALGAADAPFCTPTSPTCRRSRGDIGSRRNATLGRRAVHCVGCDYIMFFTRPRRSYGTITASTTSTANCTKSVLGTGPAAARRIGRSRPMPAVR